MPPIVRTARADEDFVEIWLGVATRDPAVADRVLDEIEALWRQLARHPLSGVAREDVGPGIRHLVAAPYLILYRVEADAVRIVRVLHARRRIDAGNVSGGT